MPGWGSWCVSGEGPGARQPLGVLTLLGPGALGLREVSVDGREEGGAEEPEDRRQWVSGPHGGTETPASLSWTTGRELCQESGVEAAIGSFPSEDRWGLGSSRQAEGWRPCASTLVSALDSRRKEATSGRCPGTQVTRSAIRGRGGFSQRQDCVTGNRPEGVARTVMDPAERLEGGEAREAWEDAQGHCAGGAVSDLVPDPTCP